VGGGIYTSTTWTRVNSPYIVDSNIVVFPGVTLTIEPGVVVKFADNQFLNIRQAQLIANGTITDSIIFTSNSLSPSPGIYSGLLADEGYGSQISYCSFKYAASVFGGDTIRHCTATYNVDGLTSLNLIDSCIVKYCTGQGAGSHDIRNSTLSNNNLGAAPGFNVINCIIDSNTTFGIEYNGGGSGIISNCKIRYNYVGIEYGNYNVDSCIISHNQFGMVIIANPAISNSIIDSNFIGILNGRFAGFSSNTGGTIHVSNCEINYNSIGIDESAQSGSPGKSTISDCRINYNGTGIQDYVPTYNTGNTITRNYIENDSIGIILAGFPDTILCNSICSNISYGMKYLGQNNINVINNNWCTTDSAFIESIIYDGYDNISYGLVAFLPVDTTCSPVSLTSINEISTEHIFQIFPNPATSTFTIKNISSIKPSLLQIINVFGEIVYTEKLFAKNEYVVDANFAKGIYFVSVSDKENNVVRKLIIE
jgi:hypothetical protein